MHAMGIDDAYRVERVLANGALGATELVTLDGSGPFVRKRIPSRLARRGVWATLADCGCTRLPRVEATYEMPDEFVVVCDYVPGENLHQLVQSRGRLGEGEASRLMGELCEAVLALHEHGIVHRDISPTNVVVAADGAHLIDFGIARFRVEGATRDTTQLGTYGFASPEQYGFAQTDARSDIYSLGRLLGYVLTGVLPENAERYEALLSDDAVVGPRLRAVICRASAMEPSHRFQSVGDFAAALRGESVAEPGRGEGRDHASPGRDGPRLTPRPSRAGVRFALAALAVAALVVAALVGAGVLAGGGGGEATGGDQQAGQLGSPADAPDDAAGSEASNAQGGVADSSATGSSASGSLDEGDALEIVESGWSVDSQGYVHYAIGLRNSGDALIALPGFTITGRDADGTVLFSDEQYLNSAPAGETTYFGFLAGNGVVPTTVEFKVIGLRDFQVEAGSSVSSFEVVDARAVEDGLGGTAFAGDLRAVSEGDSDPGMGEVAVTVVLRDNEGRIVYGNTGYAVAPEVGETSSFEVGCHGAPAYATFEVYAQPW